MTSTSIAAQLNDLNNQVVTADGHTRGELKAAFDKALAPGAYWKDAISTVCTPEERDLTVAAIEFFVGGPTTVTPRTFTHRGEQVALLVITNAGYYANIGA
jgi:hypothetical protein